VLGRATPGPPGQPRPGLLYGLWGALLSTFADLKEKGLLEKQPPVLGDRPVCVVKGHLEKDMAKMYDVGVKAGNGTEDERVRY
jgi:hypothetical protein